MTVLVCLWAFVLTLTGIGAYRIGRTIGAEQVLKLKEKLEPLNVIDGFTLPTPDDLGWKNSKSGFKHEGMGRRGEVTIAWTDLKQCPSLLLNDATGCNLAQLSWKADPKIQEYYLAIRKNVGQRLIDAVLDTKQLTEI